LRFYQESACGDNFLRKIKVSIILLALTCFFSIQWPALASPDRIEVSSHNAVSEFPDGIRFSIEAHSVDIIDEIALRMRIGEQKSGVYEYFDIEPGQKVVSELFWKTNTSSKYIPPGTILEYSFEVTDLAGNKKETELFELVLYDSRFQWEEIEEAGVNVAYHGPVESRAVEILNAILKTMDFMEPVLGQTERKPIRVTMYNNVNEMLGGLPPKSSTHRRELVTEGVAFSKIGTLLVLGGGRSSEGTASHEITHILVERAAGSVYSNIPSWLNEGLAEFGNPFSSFSYEVAVDFAVHSGRFLPLTSMPAMPGDPEDVIMYYGLSRSLIEYMVIELGPTKMVYLMSRLKAGEVIDDAILSAYGISKIELENDWRRYIGAPLYEPPAEIDSLPTPVPRSSVKVFSLTPQAGSTSVESLTGNSSNGVGDSKESETNPQEVDAQLDAEGQVSPDSRSCGGVTQSVPDGSALLLAGFVFFVALKRPFLRASSKFRNTSRE